MADQATIVVHPSGADTDLMPARDALNHVLDFLALLHFAEGKDDLPGVVWLLEEISSNSPITARLVGALQSNDGSPAFSATAALAAFEAGVEAAIEGKAIPGWMLNGAYATAHRFFKRNTESVGQTDLTLGIAAEPVVVPFVKARNALLNLERAAIEKEQKERDWTHTAYGSIEGRVAYAGSYRSRPAVWVRERKTGKDIRCVFDPETAKRVGERFNWETAWNHASVIVEGAISYGRTGDVEQVAAIDVVETTVGGLMDIADFADPTFTNGLSPSEYLDRWRDQGRE